VEDGSACVGGKKKVRKTGNEKGRSGWISDGVVEDLLEKRNT
jgi:hypothetical protein